MACRSRLAALSRGAVQCLLRENGPCPPALPATPSAQWNAPQPLLRPFSSSSAAPLNTEAIKELRARTGAPMKDVKAALEAANWDMEAAMTELRKKGMASAGKRKAREASEGLLGLGEAGAGAGGPSSGPVRAALVEVNCETDFVARNDLFRHLVTKIATAAAQAVPPAQEGACSVAEIPVDGIQRLVVDMAHAKMRGERSVEEAVAEVSAVTGENVVVRRALGAAVGAQWGFLGPYVHGGAGDGLGRIGALVALSHGGPGPSQGARARIEEDGKDLAMHVVALRPQFLSRSDVPGEVLQHEKDILRAQALESGKPEKVVEKMVTGRLGRFYGETVLLEQPFVRDGSMTVSGFLAKESKELSIPLQIRSFVRLELGQSAPTICALAPSEPHQRY